MATESIDIIYGERVTPNVSAEVSGQAIWLSGADLARVSGWTLKTEGFCKDDVCVPVPPARRGELVDGDRYNLAGLARLLDQPLVVDHEHHVCCVGAAAAERKRALTSLTAPEFALPDLEGKLHSLSQYRGKKVLLASWASW